MMRSSVWDRRRGGMVLAAGLAGGVIALAFTASAFGQSITGGCSATVNGRDPRQLTQDSPLKVKKGQAVNLRGSVPPAAGGGRIKSSTLVKVNTPIWMPDLTFGPFKGTGASWGGRVKPPSLIFTLASGIYKVHGRATGTGGWTCTGSGYIQLGDAAAAEAGLGGLLGAGGATAVATGRKPKGGKPEAGDPRLSALAGGDPPPKKAATPEEALVREIAGVDKDTRKNLGADLVMFFVLLIMFALLGMWIGSA